MQFCSMSSEAVRLASSLWETSGVCVRECACACLSNMPLLLFQGSVSQTACMSSCKHLANKLRELLLDDEVCLGAFVCLFASYLSKLCFSHKLVSPLTKVIAVVGCNSIAVVMVSISEEVEIGQ